MESFVKILAVAGGGALGATLRYLINISPLQNYFGKFPFPTFFINIVGSFLIGFCLIILTEKFTVSETLKLLILVGFLGAFTTFSTFELEIWELVKDSQYITAFAYFFLSVLLGFAGVAAGVFTGKKF